MGSKFFCVLTVDEVMVVVVNKSGRVIIAEPVTVADGGVTVEVVVLF